MACHFPKENEYSSNFLCSLLVNVITALISLLHANFLSFASSKKNLPLTIFQAHNTLRQFHKVAVVAIRRVELLEVFPFNGVAQLDQVTKLLHGGLQPVVR